MNVTRFLKFAAPVAALAVAVPLAAFSAPGSAVAVFTAGTTPPSNAKVVGVVSDHLCRRPWDPAATDAEALQPLEAKAQALGANGLVDVRFDRRRTSLKAPCWQKVTVTATAVVLGAALDR